MKYTWKEYQNALEVVRTFEDEKEEIRSQRIVRQNPINTYSQILWKLKRDLNNIQYEKKSTGANTEEWVKNYFETEITRRRNKLIKFKKEWIQKRRLKSS